MSYKHQFLCKINTFVVFTIPEQVNEGLDRAIMTMKKGEHATVTVDAKYLHGQDISGMLPANSMLHYEVELLDFIKVIVQTA